ncbi:2-hydroxychromene-2-carboxylate isomerase [Ponticoccus sp. SC2-23]|uniref:2-hydroxychromene-2-carboxylate isomerase n=1 Tax=Alexandriicola marinus TaxID=2081710 RepID=UPI000FD94AD0|nr:2-hydroxychromene-2-carboxylate isomerase [Alexandriicola marinus]MBM1220078.1 2-hydroxychromene-2-carboxylate isomerase [Ponticoccus sp. SC6-9]MBM1224764.1 2-hydroxychromene-2-carboxylate isomerase [Ponticoccus sp. SC6-15]MBM1228277.1 2-hydroxychromene-2-carboxylate isomerase [Ponticoccus sp. SC6-38]MBM1234085.1 2-hydroxychromene-2-carboxylate isomerase [Ponticoccus sp. SC6-45]MBM1238779.1 2-hydroxychromene-2-carboxylate isomerase [Ponticoccus sp. SC6-49]MBM1242560.1 2-hydroxychromene-2-c
MPHIDYFFATLSPFAYLAGTRLEEIAQRHGATVTYRPLDISALFARTGGTPLAERSEGRKAYRLQELRRQAQAAGLSINARPAYWPTNGAPSAFAIIAAQSAGGGDMGRLVHGLLAASWAEEKDIAEDAVIRDCLAAAGFDPDLADKGLMAGAIAYEDNLEEAVNRGVFGSPFYITDEDERFWGQDRLADLDAHLAARG